MTWRGQKMTADPGEKNPVRDYRYAPFQAGDASSLKSPSAIPTYSGLITDFKNNFFHSLSVCLEVRHG